jgi:hypothetical protein
MRVNVHIVISGGIQSSLEGTLGFGAGLLPDLPEEGLGLPIGSAYVSSCRERTDELCPAEKLTSGLQP